ncbi:MAG: phage integrase N-terminal SAM-like domain-containing protein [Desulfobacterales bacterium]
MASKKSGRLCMKGRIYSEEKCPLCGGVFFHDEKRGGLFCKQHPQIAANRQFIVRFGRSITKRFVDYLEAERFLNGLRYENDKGTFDIRDYRKDNPLGFENLANKWLEQKKRTKVKPKTIQSYTNFINKAIDAWGQRNIKTIGTAEVEDFLFTDHRTPNGDRITDKTRHNMKSCLHQFFAWVKRREKTYEMPELPEIEFELGWRRIVSIEVQQAIINEVKRIAWDVDPKIWIGIKLLATYIKIRPGEMRNVRERDINLESGFIHIPHPKEGSRKQGKFAYLDSKDIELLKSFPRSINPDLYFFRHVSGRSGVKAGEQYGPKYFKKWWDKACTNLGIEGVDLYGGTKHSTATALGQFLTPEQIKRGGTGSATNKAFERYFQPRRTESIKVTSAIKKLQRKNKGDVVEFVKKKEMPG